MKSKMFYFAAVLALAFLLNNCAGIKDVKMKNNKFKQMMIKNSSHDDKNLNLNLSGLTGRVEILDNVLYFVQNWTTRSRITLRINGQIAEEIKNFNGKIIKVNGTVSKTSEWSGTIEIRSYELVSGN